MLFDPLKINEKITLKNRLVMAPMTTWSGNEDGTLSKEELAYYQARSNGVAMVITATTYTLAHGKGFDGQFYAGHDNMIRSLSSLAEIIHLGGAKAILQVFHAGRKADPNHMPDGQTRSASDVPGNREDHSPKPLTLAEINLIIESFAEVVERAYKAGFDGIEIHGANTYLLQQFFSPHANIRQDAYGGSLENRMKFLFEIINVCLERRDKLDKNFLVGYRFSPEENHEPGINLDDTLVLVDNLCQTELDYLHISLGDFKQTSIRRGDDRPVLKTVLSAINGRKSFIGVGSIFTEDDAKEALETGIDLVAIGRQLLIDPQTVEKWSQGKAAFKLYDEHANLQIPRGLNKRILAYEGWVPLKI